MKTQLLTDVRQAAAILQHGGLVAFPTETVFGLGVDATNASAIGKLYRAKGRPADNPLIVHVGAVHDWNLAARELTPAGQLLLDQFAPGPITVVLPKHSSISPLVTAGLDTVGVRIPRHRLAQELLQAVALPIAAPSANRSGRPSCTTWQSVAEDLDGAIDAILMGDTSPIGIESTVVDCVNDPPILLRPGAITWEQLQSTIPNLRGGELELDAAAPTHRLVQSPGTRHPHYQPAAEVILVAGCQELALLNRDLQASAYCGLITPQRLPELGYCKLFQNVDDYAQGYYEFLREADRQGVDRIYCQLVPGVGMGRALNDRVQRSAAPRTELPITSRPDPNAL